jgi:hypothetical protein
VLLPIDTHRKFITPITAVLLPFVTYLLTHPVTISVGLEEVSLRNVCLETIGSNPAIRPTTGEMLTRYGGEISIQGFVNKNLWDTIQKMEDIVTCRGLCVTYRQVLDWVTGLTPSTHHS